MAYFKYGKRKKPVNDMYLFTTEHDQLSEGKLNEILQSELKMESYIDKCESDKVLIDPKIWNVHFSCVDKKKQMDTLNLYISRILATYKASYVCLPVDIIQNIVKEKLGIAENGMVCDGYEVLYNREPKPVPDFGIFNFTTDDENFKGMFPTYKKYREYILRKNKLDKNEKMTGCCRTNTIRKEDHVNTSVTSTDLGNLLNLKDAQLENLNGMKAVETIHEETKTGENVETPISTPLQVSAQTATDFVFKAPTTESNKLENNLHQEGLKEKQAHQSVTKKLNEAARRTNEVAKDSTDIGRTIGNKETIESSTSVSIQADAKKSQNYQLLSKGASTYAHGNNLKPKTTKSTTKRENKNPKTSPEKDSPLEYGIGREATSIKVVEWLTKHQYSSYTPSESSSVKSDSSQNGKSVCYATDLVTKWLRKDRNSPDASSENKYVRSESSTKCEPVHQCSEWITQRLMIPTYSENSSSYERRHVDETLNQNDSASLFENDYFADEKLDGSSTNSATANCLNNVDKCSKNSLSEINPRTVNSKRKRLNHETTNQVVTKYSDELDDSASLFRNENLNKNKQGGHYSNTDMNAEGAIANYLQSVNQLSENSLSELHSRTTDSAKKEIAIKKTQILISDGNNGTANDWHVVTNLLNEHNDSASLFKNEHFDKDKPCSHGKNGSDTNAKGVIANNFENMDQFSENLSNVLDKTNQLHKVTKDSNELTDDSASLFRNVHYKDKPRSYDRNDSGTNVKGVIENYLQDVDQFSENSLSEPSSRSANSARKVTSIEKAKILISDDHREITNDLHKVTDHLNELQDDSASLFKSGYSYKDKRGSHDGDDPRTNTKEAIENYLRNTNHSSESDRHTADSERKQLSVEKTKTETSEDDKIETKGNSTFMPALPNTLKEPTELRKGIVSDANSLSYDGNRNKMSDEEPLTNNISDSGLVELVSNKLMPSSDSVYGSALLHTQSKEPHINLISEKKITDIEQKAESKSKMTLDGSMFNKKEFSYTNAFSGIESGYLMHSSPSTSEISISNTAERLTDVNTNSEISSQNSTESVHFVKPRVIVSSSLWSKYIPPKVTKTPIEKTSLRDTVIEEKTTNLTKSLPSTSFFEKEKQNLLKSTETQVGQKQQIITDSSPSSSTCMRKDSEARDITEETTSTLMKKHSNPVHTLDPLVRSRILRESNDNVQNTMCVRRDAATEERNNLDRPDGDVDKTTKVHDFPKSGASISGSTQKNDLPNDSILKLLVNIDLQSIKPTENVDKYRSDYPTASNDDNSEITRDIIEKLSTNRLKNVKPTRGNKNLEYSSGSSIASSETDIPSLIDFNNNNNGSVRNKNEKWNDSVLQLLGNKNSKNVKFTRSVKQYRSDSSPTSNEIDDLSESGTSVDMDKGTTQTINKTSIDFKKLFTSKLQNVKPTGSNKILQYSPGSSITSSETDISGSIDFNNNNNGSIGNKNEKSNDSVLQLLRNGTSKNVKFTRSAKQHRLDYSPRSSVTEDLSEFGSFVDMDNLRTTQTGNKTSNDFKELSTIKQQNVKPTGSNKILQYSPGSSITSSETDTSSLVNLNNNNEKDNLGTTQTINKTLNDFKELSTSRPQNAKPAGSNKILQYSPGSSVTSSETYTSSLINLNNNNGSVRNKNEKSNDTVQLLGNKNSKNVKFTGSVKQRRSDSSHTSNETYDLSESGTSVDMDKGTTQTINKTSIDLKKLFTSKPQNVKPTGSNNILQYSPGSSITSSETDISSLINLNNNNGSVRNKNEKSNDTVQLLGNKNSKNVKFTGSVKQRRSDSSHTSNETDDLSESGTSVDMDKGTTQTINKTSIDLKKLFTSKPQNVKPTGSNNILQYSPGSSITSSETDISSLINLNNNNGSVRNKNEKSNDTVQLLGNKNSKNVKFTGSVKQRRSDSSHTSNETYDLSESSTSVDMDKGTTQTINKTSIDFKKLFTSKPQNVKPTGSNKILQYSPGSSITSSESDTSSLINLNNNNGSVRNKNEKSNDTVQLLGNKNSKNVKFTGSAKQHRLDSSPTSSITDDLSEFGSFVDMDNLGTTQTINKTSNDFEELSTCRPQNLKPTGSNKILQYSPGSSITSSENDISGSGSVRNKNEKWNDSILQLLGNRNSKNVKSTRSVKQHRSDSNTFNENDSSQSATSINMDNTGTTFSSSSLSGLTTDSCGYHRSAQSYRRNDPVQNSSRMYSLKIQQGSSPSSVSD